MRLLVPPPLYALGFAVITWVLDFLFPSLRYELPGQLMTGLVLLGFGFFIAAYAGALFIKAKTTINPHHPDKSEALVTSGVYQVTRNPMYLGMAVALTGIVFLIGNPVGILSVMAFVAVITHFQIKPEEEILLKKFGSAYSDYMKQVRRWV